MKTIINIVCSSCLALAAAAMPAAAQPQIELPPEEPKPALPKPAGIALPRESAIEVPLGDAPGITGTAIGAYGEVVLNAPLDEKPNTVDVRRLVLYVGHNFTERLRVSTEIEIEHAIASSSDKGEIEVEQAFVDYLVRRWLNLRAGLVLMPVGIVNQYHEPPTFNGADRPETDTRIVPSTWREIGAGVFGGRGPVRWQLYAVTGFAAIKLDDQKHLAGGFDAGGLREGHQEGQFARARDWGVVGRVDYAPLPWLDVGVAGYFANAGQGQLRGFNVPVSLVEADVRLGWKGLQLRAEYANVWIGHADALNAARMSLAAPGATVEPVSGQLRGGYVEAGYNVLQRVNTRYNSSLTAFGRYERTDTQAAVTVGKVPGKDRQVMTFGLVFRPIAEVAVKLDYQRLWTDAPSSWNQLNAALAFMF